MKGKKKKIITRQKALIMGAQMLSAVFNPLYLPIVGLMALFAFSYLTLLPLLYKLQVLILVYWFTVLMPMAIIRDGTSLSWGIARSVPFLMSSPSPVIFSAPT